MNTNTQAVSAAVTQNADQREVRSIIFDHLVKIESKYPRAKLLIEELEKGVQTASVFLNHIMTVRAKSMELYNDQFTRIHCTLEEINTFKAFAEELDILITALKKDLRIT